MKVAILKSENCTVSSKGLKKVFDIFLPEVDLIDDADNVRDYNFLIIAGRNYNSMELWEAYKTNKQLYIVLINKLDFILQKILISIFESKKVAIKKHNLRILSLIFHDLFKNKLTQGEKYFINIFNDFAFFVELWNNNGGSLILNIDSKVRSIIQTGNLYKTNRMQKNILINKISALDWEIKKKTDFLEV